MLLFIIKRGHIYNGRDKGRIAVDRIDVAWDWMMPISEACDLGFAFRWSYHLVSIQLCSILSFLSRKTQSNNSLWEESCLILDFWVLCILKMTYALMAMENLNMMKMWMRNIQGMNKGFILSSHPCSAVFRLNRNLVVRGVENQCCRRKPPPNP